MNLICSCALALYIPFVDSYAATQRPSMAANFYGCPGELVGACINRAAQIQHVEGSYCRRTIGHFTATDSTGASPTASELLIMAWVEGGMVER